MKAMAEDFAAAELIGTHSPACGNSRDTAWTPTASTRQARCDIVEPK